MAEALTASPTPALIWTPDEVIQGSGLQQRLFGLRAPERSLDRDLHRLMLSRSSVLPPRYTSSIDAAVRAIEQALPGWVHGYQFMPEPVEDPDDLPFVCRAWVAGHGYISDDHIQDYFPGDGPTPAAALMHALINCLLKGGLDQ